MKTSAAAFSETVAIVYTSNTGVYVAQTLKVSYVPQYITHFFIHDSFHSFCAVSFIMNLSISIW